MVAYSGPSIKRVRGRTGLPPEWLRETHALTLKRVKPGEAGKAQCTRWLSLLKILWREGCWLHSSASSQTLALLFRTAYERESNSQTEHFPVGAVS